MREGSLTIGKPPRSLEAVFAEGAAGARAGAVVCHPHPQYGGSMDNPVVVAVARALVEDGLAVLRFNFGGVGRSEGGFTGGPGEVEDVRTALASLGGRLPPGIPLALVGYSFGAWAGLCAAASPDARLAGIVGVGPPLDLLDWDFLTAVDAPITLIAGDRDQYCAADHLASARRRYGEHIAHQTIRGADHFFGGREREVAAAVADAIRRVA